MEDDVYSTFLQKFNELCNIRCLILEGLLPDPQEAVTELGLSLASNSRLEVLVLKENKIKWAIYQEFWVSIMPNKTI